jgi:hypothetical protein
MRHGLLPTGRLLDLFEVDAATRAAVCDRPRQQSVAVTHTEHGHASIRDQKPLNMKRLEDALTPGTTIDEWLELLDTFVFFWPTPERAVDFLGRATYVDRDHDVITVATGELVARHADTVRLTRMNTGTTQPFAFTRGKETF